MITFSDMRKAYFQYIRPDYKSGERPASLREMRVRSKQTDLCGYSTQIAFNAQIDYSNRLKSFRKTLIEINNKRVIKENCKAKHLRRHPKR